jgi:hypothetical protein
MNVTLPQSEVIRICEDLGIAITAIESLIPSGTRVVCRTTQGASDLWRKMQAHIIGGSIKRMPRALRTAP